VIDVKYKENLKQNLLLSY